MKIFFILIFFFSFLSDAFSLTLKDNHSLNDKVFFVADSVDEYSIMVSGHFHGSSKNTSGYPAVTLRKNIDAINKSGSVFLVCLGDLFLDIKNDIPNYKKSFIDKLEMPLYNAPGNHDISGNVYEENFGKSFYSFREKSELYIVLNTELNDGSVEGEQLNMLRDAIKNLDGIKNIFIFSHRLIWAEENPSMKGLFSDNTRSANGNNFRSEILPLLNGLDKKIDIYFFGGSLGSAPSPFFYHKEGRIFYIATAIRDTPKDAMLHIKIKNGKLDMKPFPLLMPIEYYNLDYYDPSRLKTPGFNLRLVPLYIITMLSHRYFWYGVLLTMVGFTFFILIRRRTRKLK